MESSKNGDVKQTKVIAKTSRNGQPPTNNGQGRKQKQSKAKVSRDNLPAPVPPDGGWGWVITFCSFMVGFLVDGICFTFGFFFKEFQDYFGSNKSTTSSVSSVLNGTYLSIGTYVMVVDCKITKLLKWKIQHYRLLRDTCT